MMSLKTEASAQYENVVWMTVPSHAAVMRSNRIQSYVLKGELWIIKREKILLNMW
jgi:hypothetical protein